MPTFVCGSWCLPSPLWGLFEEKKSQVNELLKQINKPCPLPEKWYGLCEYNLVPHAKYWIRWVILGEEPVQIIGKEGCSGKGRTNSITLAMFKATGLQLVDVVQPLSLWNKPKISLVSRIQIKELPNGSSQPPWESYYDLKLSCNLLVQESEQGHSACN